MSQADIKKQYELKKVGKHWLIGTTGKRFQRLPVLASATEIDVSDNFLIVDEDTIYEIEENEEGKIILQKVEDASINDGERNTGDVFESTDSVDGVTCGQTINADSKFAVKNVHKDTTADKTNEKQPNLPETTAETVTKYENTKELEIGNTDDDLLKAGNTEETSLIFVEHIQESSKGTASWSENSKTQLKFSGLKKEELPVTTMKNTKSANITEFDKSESLSFPQKFDHTEERPTPGGLFHPSNGGKYVEKYTINKIIVYVYKADMLNLSVDCIVNAANKNLSHRGGEAYVIARAAGKSLTRESDQYIAENAMLPVGQACTTTAGKLHYKCVVHTVGPYWFDYSPHTEADVRRCEDDLYHAIYNCFIEAEKKKLKTIAIPAVSTAIFGVPAELCVNQYARATVDYCKKAGGEPGVLSEIHFIDMKLDMVKQIQDIFNIMVQEGRRTPYKRNYYVKQKAYRGQVSQKSQKQSTEPGVWKLPEPLVYEDGWRCNVFCFLPNNEVTICMGDISRVNTSGIVVSVNKNGQGGAVGEIVFNKMPVSNSAIVKSNLKKELKYSQAIGEVVVSDGYSCGFLKILFVVYPIEAQRNTHTQRRNDLMHAYGNVLKTASRDTKIQSVATTLFGIDSRVDEELKLGAEAFLSSYLSYCEQMKDDTSGLKVKIVCKTEHAHDVMCSVFNNYVQSQM